MKGQLRQCNQHLDSINSFIKTANVRHLKTLKLYILDIRVKSNQLTFMLGPPEYYGKNTNYTE